MKIALLSLAAVAAIILSVLGYGGSEYDKGYESGVLSVQVDVQDEAIGAIASVDESKTIIASNDARRYHETAKSLSDLQISYDTLLAKSKRAVAANEPEKYTICTYDADDIQLLNRALKGAGNGSGDRASANQRSRAHDPVRLSQADPDWYKTGAGRADHRKRSPVLRQSMYSAKFDSGGTGKTKYITG